MDEHESARWVVLYRSALLELDRAKLPDRIREATEAIHQRLQELRAKDADKVSSEERGVLEDALQNLRTLAKIVT